MQTPFRNSLMASGALPAGRQAVVKIGRRKTKKKTPSGKSQTVSILSMVPEAGLEPARCCHRQILSLVRLPFRHSGMQELYGSSALIKFILP